VTISALVRKQFQASILKDAGVIPLLFKDLDDYEAIYEAALDADGNPSVLPSSFFFCREGTGSKSQRIEGLMADNGH
jgi:hypothetical protein